MVPAAIAALRTAILGTLRFDTTLFRGGAAAAFANAIEIEGKEFHHVVAAVADEVPGGCSGGAGLGSCGAAISFYYSYKKIARMLTGGKAATGAQGSKEGGSAEGKQSHGPDGASSSRSVRQPTPKRGLCTIKSLLEVGLLTPAPDALRVVDKSGIKHAAALGVDGTITFKNRVYASLSALAMAILKKVCNGWVEVCDASGRNCAELREIYAGGADSEAPKVAAVASTSKTPKRRLLSPAKMYMQSPHGHTPRGGGQSPASSASLGDSDPWQLAVNATEEQHVATSAAIAATSFTSSEHTV